MGPWNIAAGTLVVLATVFVIAGVVALISTGSIAGFATRHLEYDDQGGLADDSSRTGCKLLCDFHGVSAPCGARMQWAADHHFTGAMDACQRAQSVVSQQ